MREINKRFIIELIAYGVTIVLGLGLGLTAVALTSMT